MTLVQLAEAEHAAILKRLRASGRPLKKKKRFTPDAATAKALRESGLSEADVATLVEGTEHERRFLIDTGAVRFRPEIPARVADALGVLQEAVDSSVSSASALTPPTGWTSRADTPDTFSHSTHGSLHLKNGRWVHRDKAGTIRGSGANQESMTGYLRGLGSDPNTAAADAASASGSDAAAESLAVILGRIRSGGRDTVPAAAHALVEARLRPTAPDLAATHRLVAERLDRREAVPAEARNLVEALRAGGRLPSGSGSGSPDLHTRLRAALAR
jgi:hypothetical protein